MTPLASLASLFLWRWMVHRLSAVILCVLLLSGAPPALSGQDLESDPNLLLQAKQLQESLARAAARLADLERRIEESKKTLGSGTPDGTPATPPVIAVSQQEYPVPRSANMVEETPVDLSGYFNFRLLKNGVNKGPATFQAHVVSLFVGKTIGSWQFFSELEFEYAPRFDSNGSLFTTQRGEILLETAWVNYNHRDMLNARAGLLLVPTYWRIHHYPSVTLSVTDPLIDKRIFPADVVGVMLHGSKYTGANARLEYTLLAGNGRGADPGRQDWNGHKATGGTVVAELPTHRLLDLFEVGAQLYRDETPGDLRENIFGFQSRMAKGPVSFLGEFAHADLLARNGTRQYFREGFYLQPSVRISRWWHAFYRYDQLNFDSRSAHDRDQRRHAVGGLFRPRPNIALKLELDRYCPESSSRKPYNAIAGGIALFFR